MLGDRHEPVPAGRGCISAHQCSHGHKSRLIRRQERRQQAVVDNSECQSRLGNGPAERSADADVPEAGQQSRHGQSMEAMVESHWQQQVAIRAQVAGAGLIYLSGGHPTFLADTLRDTLVWEAIVREWRAGAALAGCSAGAMVMGSWVPSIRHPRGGGTEGLKLVDNLRVIPHFDAFFSKVPDVVTRFMAGGASPSRLLGIDEETALVGGPGHWVVEGRGAVWLLSADEPRRFDAGSEVPLD